MALGPLFGGVSFNPSPKSPAMDAIQYHCPSLKSKLTGEHDVQNGIVNFRGIPYASISKRWSFASPKESLQSPFDATKFGPRCPQPNDSPLVSGGVNDPTPGDDEFKCLNLNVTLPLVGLRKGNEADRGDLLPVMVWVHGGSFKTGSNSIARYRPQILSSLAQNLGLPVVIVQLNYRLGVFSFAVSHDSDMGSGKEASEERFARDLGLSDQYHAFQWVQNHIQDFGGDPENVTAFGISAGSASLHHQIISGRPLFDRAILMSGLEPLIGRRSRQTLNNGWENLSKRCNTVGETSMTANVMDKLYSLSSEELIEYYGIVPLAMVAEQSPKGSNIWRVGDAHPNSRCKEIILGDSRVEAIILDSIGTQIPPTRFQQLARSHFRSLDDAVLFYQYFGFNCESQEYEDYRDALRKFLSVVIFHYPNIKVAEDNGPTTYLYHFEEPSPYLGPTHGIPYHGQCGLYMYQNDSEQHSDGARHTSRLMAEKWIAFAYGRTPWEPFTQNKRYFRFGPHGKCGLTSFEDDDARTYEYLDWLREHFEEAERLILALRGDISTK